MVEFVVVLFRLEFGDLVLPVDVEDVAVGTIETLRDLNKQLSVYPRPTPRSHQS